MSQKKVLVIEDNPVYVRIIEKRLQNTGFITVTAQDGLLGYNLAKKIQPDLIVLDLMLPTMDGHKVCRLLKFDKTTKAIPVLILTSRGGEADVELSRYTRADAFLAKTVKSEEMIATVRRLLENAEHFDVERISFGGEELEILKCKHEPEKIEVA